MKSVKEILVYEDNNLLILNKPFSLLSQKDGSGDISLEDYVEEYLGNKNAKLINRLDKDTTGLIVFGKNENSIKFFNEVFSDHEKVTKQYLTLVSGKILKGGIIDAPIRKNFQKHKMVIAPVKDGGKEAITTYEPKVILEDSTLLQVTLKTGRTHQIRVHMSYIRHHVIGDYKYGDFKINNVFKKEHGIKFQVLHSYKLIFHNLTKFFDYLNDKVFEAPIPEYLNKVLSNKK